ncbi:MAG: hypothetical protein DDT42_00454 [candidate division WS2 bacterium]|uniref:Uncharacterized protein n=1 Tax=Psychracetigena formicireducens TaxID=2986056 RepID=A0A9E2F1D2_PSYF1|nr:hypothetical protein [Candidatus Psychracetigena formicireducens]
MEKLEIKARKVNSTLSKLKSKKKVGRKLFDDKNEEIVLQKLEQVWGIGGSDKEAAFFGGISIRAYYDYLKKHSTISARKEALKNQPILKARQELVRGLSGNPELAFKYLERKLPDEFGLKGQVKVEEVKVEVVYGKKTSQGKQKKL